MRERSRNLCTVKRNIADRVESGGKISYDDGRPGHRGVQATVLHVVDGHGMLVQFDDRADTTYILFSDPRWMDFIWVAE